VPQSDEKVTLALTALASYRLTRLVTTDTLLEPWREQVFNRWPPTWDRARLRWTSEHRHVMRAPEDTVPVRHWAKLLDCSWCAGVWVTAAVVLATRHHPRRVLTWLGLSTVVGMIGSVDGALA
jgi:hypothetical protein